jgi:PAS domain S-box-containing protein
MGSLPGFFSKEHWEEMEKAAPDASKAQKPLMHDSKLPIQVLYIDDEPDLLEIGKLFLERTGTFAVTVLSSAEEGLSTLTGQSFDAIISDYQMPEMDGITFLKELRHRGDQTPFILFTGRGREEIAIEAYEQGADHYVQKGGGPSAQFVELAHKIRRSVEKHKIEEKNRTLTRRLDFISRINKVLAQNRDRDELLAKICSLVIQYGTFELSWAGFIDPEQSMVVPYIACSREGQLPDIPGISLSDPEEQGGDDPCGDALIRGFPYTCNDLSHLQENSKWRGWAERNGYGSLCSVPLRLYSEPIGAFMLLSKECRAFNQDQIEMLTEMGDDISFALSTLEGEARRHSADDSSIERRRQAQPPDYDQLLDLIDHSADGILLTSEEGMILIWNRRMEEITGILKVQALGIPLGAIVALLCEDSDPQEYQQIEQMLRTGLAPFSKEPHIRRLITPAGEYTEIEVIRSVLSTGCGFRIMSIIREIFRHSSNESTENSTESECRMLIEDLPEVIYTVNEHGVITGISPAIERFSYSPLRN